jgi:hypothetical protein
MSISDFRPMISNRQNGWTASIEIPVIGLVTVRDNDHEQAKLKLWLVVCAVEKFAESSRTVSDFSKWTKDDWRAVLNQMNAVAKAKTE